MANDYTTTGIILAAGKGTRLGLDVPKVLVPLRGKPMIFWIIEAMHKAGIENIIVVVGHRAEEVKKAIVDAGYNVDFATQDHQIGTGNAVEIAIKQVTPDTQTVLVTYGDKPLISAETFKNLVEKQQGSGVVQVITAVECHNPAEMGYGRIIRDAKGHVTKMVEQKECSPEELVITECNGGPVCFDRLWLQAAMKRSKQGPSGEIYLTDLIRLAYAENEIIAVVPMTGLDEAHGINTLGHLQQAEDIVNRL